MNVNFLPILGLFSTSDFIWAGFALVLLLALVGAAVYIGVCARNERVANQRQRRRDRRATTGFGNDFFQLDMSRYEEKPVDSPEASRELFMSSNDKSFPQPVKASLSVVAPDTLPSEDDEEAPLASPRTQLNTVQRKLSLPSNMMRIMDTLKSNRRYEFSEISGRQNRLGAPCTGGLFAEVHFGRSEDDSVLHGLLNPD